MLPKVLGASGIAVVLLSAALAAVAVIVAIFDVFGGTAASPEVMADIPADRLALYQKAANVCPGLDWSVLAAIGRIETNHGRSTLPGVSSGENFAGAGGSMQFLAPTFAGVVARHQLPPSGANPPSRYNPSDAIHAAAYYLCDSGAPHDMYRAIWAYNHADWYVRDVLAQAKRYAAQPPPGSGDCANVRAPNPAAAVAIGFACKQIGLPYVWGGNGPTVNGGWDCSGLTKAAYQAARISLPRTAQEQYYARKPIPENQLQPGDLVFYGTASNIHHVGMYLGAGKMINAPTFGIPVKIGDYRYSGDDFYGAVRPFRADARGGS